MFDFLKRNKKINTNDIKNFEAAIKAIKVYLQLSNWANATKALDEISYKEKTSFNNLIENLEIENNAKNVKIINNEKKEYEKKGKEIQKLREILEEKKIKYLKKIEKDRFEIRFKKIENEINTLLWKREFLEAKELLQEFLEENKEKELAINFYNSQNRKIQKSLEKQKKYEQDKIKRNTRYEALSLIWETQENDNINEENKKKSFFKGIKEKFRNYKNLQENKKSKALLDEVNLLLEEDDKMKREIAERKLENIHKWLVREINIGHIIGYDFYWKILWANKISWDTFWIEETKENYVFFIWDATWHWIRAWFIITLLSKLFNINYNKPFQELVFEINNQLKQDLKSRNFVTWIFFEIDKKTNNIQYIWMWHEPMLLYKSKTKAIERVIPWGLAMWIVTMKDRNLVKIKDLKLEDWDILMCYSDWLVEAKSIDWEFYGIKKLEEIFVATANNESNVNIIYDHIINDIKLFRWWSHFDDDLTITLLKRDSENDIVKKWDEYIKSIQVKEWLNSSELKNIEWKTKKEIVKELEIRKKKEETKRIVWNLEVLYQVWEMLKLKEEATRYIKEWYVDKKINFYLKKAMENETKYKINLRNQKMQAKYNVLNELYKKWDYETIIKEIEDIISKDWNI
jgi:serine phosphatase RsbU (regulator of sigma subunit)